MITLATSDEFRPTASVKGATENWLAGDMWVCFNDSTMAAVLYHPGARWTARMVASPATREGRKGAMARAERAILAAAIAAVVVMAEWCRSQLAYSTRSSSGWVACQAGDEQRRRDRGLGETRQPRREALCYIPSIGDLFDSLSSFGALSAVTGTGHG